MNFQARLILLTAFILLLTFFNLHLQAAIKVSQINGNWSNPASWGTAPPAHNDDVIISSGTIINLNTSLPGSSSLQSLTIQPGGLLIVTVNGSTLRLHGNLINDGTINLWQTNSLQADIVLYGDSYWSGFGEWSLSTINVQESGLEISPGLLLTINGNVNSAAGGSFNKINHQENITMNLRGTANSSLASSGTDFFYGNVDIRKDSASVSFAPSASANQIQLAGNLNITGTNDRLNIGDNNTLIIQALVTGSGLIAGGNTCSLVIDNITAPAVNPLRILSGTTFQNFVVNRASGVVLTEGFNVRDNLVLNNSSRLQLSGQTLSLGANGLSPAPGNFSGNGFLVGSTTSKLSIRGNNPDPTVLRFAQLNSSEYTINNFIVDKVNGITSLDNSSTLIVTGFLDVYDNNQYSIGSSILTLNSVPHFFGTGCLKGSSESNVNIAGIGTTSYSLSFDQSSSEGHTLKNYSQSRRATITLATKLNISERLNLTGNSSVLASNGNLTLMSSATQTAAVGSLLNSANVIGDVVVQVYLSGNNTDMRYRGFRSLSSPINDSLIADGSKKTLEQLRDFIIITGPGGVSNGFDQGGVSQPFAQTLSTYNPLATNSLSAFIPVEKITQLVRPGSGFYAYFRGMQMGTYSLNASKLNSPYIPPEPVIVEFRGPINKFDLPAIRLVSRNDSVYYHTGYNLIGNPYPSSIDWTRVVRGAGVNDEVRILKPTGGTTTYLNGFSNNGGSPYIQTGQGFFVRTSIDGATVRFQETCKTFTDPPKLLNEPLQNAILSHKSPRSRAKVIRLNISNESEEDETTIVFMKNEKSQADYNDAMYFSGSTVSLASISENGQRMAINFMPEIESVKEIGLSVNASKTGSYKLSFTDIPVSSVELFLKDSLRGNELMDVNNRASYTFSIDKLDPATFGDKRFSLIFKPKPTAKRVPRGKAKGIPAYPSPAADEVFFDVSSLPEGNKQVLVFDIFGNEKQVLTFSKGEKVSVNVCWLEPGLYLAKFRSEQDGKVLGKSMFIKY
jgi:hypothetical protein